MFKNEYILNRKLITEYVLNILCRNIIIVGIIILIFGLVLFLTNTISFMGLYGEIFIAFCLIFAPIIMIKNLEDNSKRLNNGKIEKTIVEFNDNIVMNEGKVHLEFEYNQIKKIKQTKHFIVLMISNKSAILVLKNGFVNGNKDEFIEFINKKN